SLAIKLEDPKGPILFKQKRIGLNGKEFNMYKFRSMVSNAEELLHGLLDKNETTGPIFKLKNDPRVTRIGRLIRRT
ncbi:sugar transferase, partial [Micrococcus sp. SIMBA_131]